MSPGEAKEVCNSNRNEVMALPRKSAETLLIRSIAVNLVQSQEHFNLIHLQHFFAIFKSGATYSATYKKVFIHWVYHVSLGP